jgi:hypothetical protein
LPGLSFLALLLWLRYVSWRATFLHGGESVGANGVRMVAIRRRIYLDLRAIFLRSDPANAVLCGKCGAKCPIEPQSAWQSE